MGRDESLDSLVRHDTTTLQRAVMSPVQMPRPQQQQQLAALARHAPDSNVTRYANISAADYIYLLLPCFDDDDSKNK